MVQAGCYQLVLDRKLGEYTLPERMGDYRSRQPRFRQDGHDSDANALRNRFVHLEFEVDLQDWSEWAIEAGIRPEVIAFLRFRQELLRKTKLCTRSSTQLDKRLLDRIITRGFDSG
jgi:hypothetical protein